jgi:hypothetical protein
MEIGGENYFDKCFRISDRKGSTMGQPGDDIRLSDRSGLETTP